MVKPKKHLGQHFLEDLNAAQRITESLQQIEDYPYLLEIGPGTGVLTQYLQNLAPDKLQLIEIDKESVVYLKQHYPNLQNALWECDLLQTDLNQIVKQEAFGVIGNFPYNISSQIFFQLLEYRSQVKEVVCMLQKEVAERLISPPGSKAYGILSVLLQAFFEAEYLFTVEPEAFNPPPKVRSGVIRLTRNQVEHLECNERKFRQIVKMAFGQRRKTLRNALKSLSLPEELQKSDLLQRRAETLSVAEYVFLTQQIFPE